MTDRGGLVYLLYRACHSRSTNRRKPPDASTGGELLRNVLVAQATSLHLGQPTQTPLTARRLGVAVLPGITHRKLPALKTSMGKYKQKHQPLKTGG
jgi:hypothetical protein